MPEIDLTKKIAQAYIEGKKLEILAEITQNEIIVSGRLSPTPPGQGFSAVLLVKKEDTEK
jgi:hypothetical protein